MFKLIYSIVIGLALLLSACSSHQNTDDIAMNDRAVNQSLSYAATSVSQSFFVLNKLQYTATPPRDISPPPSPASYGMALLASVNWDGPIEPLVRKICQATHYKLRVMGSRPAIPIIVTVHMTHVPVAYILESAGYQAGKRARVVVYPSLQTVDLQYIGG
jgi:defect-in-organelle-trafficking protein DotD